MANKKLPAAFSGVGGEWAWNHLSKEAQQSYLDREKKKRSGSTGDRPHSTAGKTPARPEIGQMLQQQKDRLQQEMANGLLQIEREERQSGESLKKGYEDELSFLQQQKKEEDAVAQRNYDADTDKLNRLTDRQLAEAYASTMADRRNLAQQLAAQGITGGLSESTMMQVTNEYGKNRNRLETGRQDAMEKLLEAMQSRKEENQRRHADKQEKMRRQYQESYLRLREQMQKRRDENRKYYQDILRKIREKEFSLL